MKPIPRLSRALRAFTNLSSDSGGVKQDPAQFLAELRIKRQEEQHQLVTHTFKLDGSANLFFNSQDNLGNIGQTARKMYKEFF